MREQKQLPQVINDEAFTKLLNKTKKPTHRLAFKLAYLCGMRVSEIANLKQEHLDRQRKLIFIKSGKGKKDRYVPLPIKFIKQTETDKLIPLVPNKYKTIKSAIRSFEIAFKEKIRKALDRNDLHFHNLRHSFATNLLNKGIPISDVQFWLGHRDLSTTAVYLRVSPDSALKRFEEAWSYNA